VSILEKHFSVSQVATLWNLSDDTVRKLFIDEIGVLKFTRPSRLRRKYCSLRIPESVVQRVHQRLQKKAA
jgi:hypothetical protein